MAVVFTDSANKYKYTASAVFPLDDNEVCLKIGNSL